jgi:Domain of unknown function (DUF4259)
MRTWGTGPFENEAAEALATELDNADPDEREMLLRQALQDAVDADDGVDAGTAARAVAAAAVVSASLPGAPRIESDYTPEFLARDDPPEPAADLPPLASEALDRVEENGSAWLELWREDDAVDDALGTLELIRDPLPTV